VDGFWHLAAWPVDNSALVGSAARRGERKVRKGRMVLCRRTCPRMTMSPNVAQNDNLAISALVKVLPFGQSFTIWSKYLHQ
jgi:hypothetical protein